MARSELILPPTEVQGARFVHDSLYEYLAISDLEAELDNVLSGRERDGWESFLLNRMELDYLQTSAYGYFEGVTEVAFAGRVVDFLMQPDFESVPKGVQRNLIELVGLVYSELEVAPIAGRLMELVEKPGDSKIRFNAARALERIHPSAPRPYLRYVSDWGDFTYKDFATEVDGYKLKPWVMVGYGEKQAKPGRHYRFAYRTDPTCAEETQEEISSRIEKFLTGELKKKVPSDMSVRLNASNAWIRWAHPRHLNKIGRLATDMDARFRGEPTVENLRDWVPVLCRKLHELDHKGGLSRKSITVRR